jgi:hypothetical protein
MTKTGVYLAYSEGLSTVDEEQDYLTTKLGGKPVWLNSNHPKEESLKCSNCNTQMYLLVQAFAPLDTDRILYVFVCNSSKCKNIKILRLRKESLPEKTKAAKVVDWEEELDFDSFKINDEPLDFKSVLKDLECEKKVESECLTDIKPVPNKNAVTYSKDYPVSFPSFFLSVEEEEQNEKNNKLLNKAKEIMKQYEENKHKESYSDLENPEWSKEGYEKSSDKVFDKFQSTAEYNPEQCLRYFHNGEPLYFSEKSRESLVKVPRCKCGADRVHEMQIMPHVISVLPLDDDKYLTHVPNKIRRTVMDSYGLEFGTIHVYTCSKDCLVSNEEVGLFEFEVL